MQIILLGEMEIVVRPGRAELEIESAEPEITFSPLHMFAASLATCTLSVLLSWALPAGLEVDDLELGLRWDYVDDPYRVGNFDLSIRWPSLPEERRGAALRVAGHCTVKNTLAVPPKISIGLAA